MGAYKTKHMMVQLLVSKSSQTIDCGQGGVWTLKTVSWPLPRNKDRYFTNNNFWLYLDLIRPNKTIKTKNRLENQDINYQISLGFNNFEATELSSKIVY